MQNLRRVAAIHDLSGYGKCSLTIAIPVLSSMCIEVCPVPTAILSTHTGFKNFTFVDLSDNMEATLKHWNNLRLKFSCIYSGFLGSERQIDIVLKFIHSFGAKALKLIDPVMGDNGKIYSTYTPSMCNSMRNLMKAADIITPNLTEASILLDKCYPKGEIDENTVKEWLVALCEMGPRYCIITGVEKDGFLHNFAFDKNTSTHYCYKSKKIPINISGTGDLFSSVLAGVLLNNIPFPIAVETSTNFVYSSILYTLKSGCKEKDGLQFEPLLHCLGSNVKA